MRKGEHDSALFGWMSDNGDPDNFADVLLGCDSIKTGSNAARWCDKGYDDLVKKAKLTSNPGERAKLYSRAGDLLCPCTVDCAGERQNVLRHPQQRNGVQREPDGQRFLQSETELTFFPAGTAPAGHLTRSDNVTFK